MTTSTVFRRAVSFGLALSALAIVGSSVQAAAPAAVSKQVYLRIDDAISIWPRPYNPVRAQVTLAGQTKWFQPAPHNQEQQVFNNVPAYATGSCIVTWVHPRTGRTYKSSRTFRVIHYNPNLPGGAGGVVLVVRFENGQLRVDQTY
jgi:hypothetical protein